MQGAGKTSLLIERLLVAVGRDVAPLERMVAITFTEKAAGELRRRLAAGLERLRRLAVDGLEVDPGHEADRAFEALTDSSDGDPVPHETLRDRARTALESLDRASITTIHGFCGEVLRRFPLEAGVQPDFAVDAGEHWVERFDAYWDRFVATELGPRGDCAALWRTALSQFDLGEIKSMALAGSAFGIDHRRLVAPPSDPDALFGAHLDQLTREAEALLNGEQVLPRGPDEFCRETVRAIQTLRHGGIDALREHFDPDERPRAVLIDRRPTWTAKSADATARAAYDDLRTQVKRTLALLLEVDEARVAALMNVAGRAIEGFRESYLRAGFLDFDGLLVLTRDLLRDDVDVRRRLKREIEFLLVDEFQDTDPVQYEIVLLLGERAEGATDDAYAVDLHPGKLFVVGDAKQSIYRFRGADYTAFRRATDKIAEAGTHLSLTANFRSRPGVLEPINRVFEDADGIWQSDDDAADGTRGNPGVQPIYAAIDATRDDVARPAIEIWQPDFGGDVKADRRRLGEGRLIADAIEEAKTSGAIEHYRDVTLLFRALTTVEAYLRPLRERGIPFVVDGGKEMLKRPEIAQLLGTLRCLALPNEAVSLLAYLRSPAGAVPDGQLARWRASGGRWSWRQQPDEETFPELARAFARLRQLHDATRDLPADRAIRHVAEHSLLLPLGAAAFEGAQRIANLQKVVAAGEDLARDGRMGLEQVIDALQEGRLADLQMDRPLADDAADAVRISSIHRMKGLEAKWVLLPDLARDELDRDDESTARLVHGPWGPSLGVHIGSAKVRSAADAWQTLQDRRHRDAEEVRVLYVALTRARERIVLIDGYAGSSRPIDPDKLDDRRRKLKRALKMLLSWGHDPLHVVDGERTLAGGDVVVRRVEVEDSHLVRSSASTPLALDDAVEQWERTVATYLASCRSAFSTPSGLAGEADRREEPADVAAARPPRAIRRRKLGRLIGIVLHRTLELWDRGRDEDALELMQPLARRVADDEGVDPAELTKVCDSLLRRFLESPLATRLREVDVVGREVPILARREDGSTLRGNIDLLYVDGDDRLVVADYKTDDEAPEELVERYRPQLDAYARALEASSGTPPRAEIWSLTHGVVVEVT